MKDMDARLVTKKEVDLTVPGNAIYNEAHIKTDNGVMSMLANGNLHAYTHASRSLSTTTLQDDTLIVGDKT